ncbi:N-acetylmuramoyl-L-alanine amidase [unidentified bacterial endosymbiont]|uniref:N-acetylmuramoyl-L-alanine amidase n=1 Tax=unidentified bacterial endosymbiont TaxID=2355 RepID=UPI00209EBE65|nr:N-acetylmuramoyl-L-alanine amidase [unidentified bacterial endosymbiont]
MKIYSRPSPAQDRRIRHLVMHYTAGNLASSLQWLAGPQAQASAHYLLSDTPEADGEIPIYKLVEPEERAWHAGVSSWHGVNNINFSSVGIEMVNLGFIEAKPLARSVQHAFADEATYRDHQGRQWFCYPKEQIAALIELVAPLIKQYSLTPTRIIGHADIAPGRKQDPGPLFPWYTLACEGIGAWPRAEVVEHYQKQLKEKPLTVAQQQAALKEYGYEVPTHGNLDQTTKNTVESFKMHFSPADYFNGTENNSQAMLCALIEEYYPQARDTLLGRQLPSSGVKPSAVTSKDQLFKPVSLC